MGINVESGQLLVQSLSSGPTKALITNLHTNKHGPTILGFFGWVNFWGWWAPLVGIGIN